MKRAAVLVLATACAHPAADTHQNTSALIEAAEIDGHVHVRAPGYTMIFGADGTVRLPESLEIGSHQNVFGTDICPLESQMGTAIYPGAAAVGGQPLGGGTSTTMIEFDGPIMARVHVDYSLPYTCGPNAQHLAGKQTLTFFPDGRIVRQDTVTSSDTPLPAAGQCGCANIGAPDFFFTLFYAFDNTSQIVDQNDNPAQTDGRIEACAQWPDLTIGMHWGDPGTNTRISPNARPSFVLDMKTSSSAPFGPIKDSAHTSTMMIMSGSPHPACVTALTQIAQPSLTIEGTTVTTDAEGVYVDSRRHESAFTISSARVVPPFLIALDLGDHARITSNVEHADGWYTAQNFDPTAPTFFWFASGLASGETITIEPR